MKRAFSLLPLCVLLAVWITVSSGVGPSTSSQERKSSQTYLGFDRNIYPGDDALPVLRKTFSFVGYWLSPPPGGKTSTWLGKRELLRSHGFGFLVLYRGREERELKDAPVAYDIGEADAHATAEAAKREGFPPDTIIFLDIEQGGRLSPAYHSYIQGWLLALTLIDYQGGFYCSGVPVKEDAKNTITTADDIIHSLFAESRSFAIWTYNDLCPPSPGCSFPKNPPSPLKSGVVDAEVWQYAQSPRRKEFTTHCPANYHPDGNCYAPGDTAHAWFLDVNSATSPDPSNAQ